MRRQTACLPFLVLAACGQEQAAPTLAETPEPAVQDAGPVASPAPEVEPVAEEEEAAQSCLTNPEISAIQWHSCNGPCSVQYGQPGTDLRAIRFDCVDDQLAMAFPIEWPGDGVSEMSVDFADGEQRLGEVIELGDGTNLAITFHPGDPLPARLVQQDAIRFSLEGDPLDIPTGEGKAMLLALVRSCSN